MKEGYQHINMSTLASCCSRSSHGTSQGDGPFCACGKRAKINTSWTVKNSARRFWGCPNYRVKSPPNDCGFFQWLDPNIEDLRKIILKELLNYDKIVRTPRHKGDKERTICIELLNQIVARDDTIQRLEQVKILYLFLGIMLSYVVCKFSLL